MGKLLFIRSHQAKKKRIKKRWRLFCLILACGLIAETVVLYVNC